MRRLSSRGAASKRSAIGLGSSRFEVIAAFGAPAATETKQMKTKQVEVLKYGPIGRSFALKVVLENGRVVSWEERT